MNDILQYLKMHGERFDTEIAEAVGLSLENTRVQLTELAAKCEVVTCYSIKFDKGKKTEGTIYRVAGYTPPASPGRKSKAQLNLQ
jgi:predicted ArsR family transcriptional regulator